MGSSWVPAWQLAPGWGTGTRYNAKGRLGPAGLRSLLLGFNYIIPQPGMTHFSRNCIGGTKTKGPKGDRRGTEGDRRSRRFSVLFFFLPLLPLSLSRRLPRAPKKDRRGTERGPKGDRRLAFCWRLAHSVVMFSFLAYCYLRTRTCCLYCSQRCVFL